MAAKIIVDIILTAIVIFGAVLGIKLGFIKALSKPVKSFASLLVAVTLCTTFAISVMQPLIEGPMTAQITDFLVSKCGDMTAGDTTQLPTLIRFAAVIVDVDIGEINAVTTEEYIEAIVDKLAAPVVHLIAVILSYFVLYFLSKLAFALAFAILNQMFSGGIFGVLNKILGFVFNTAFFFMIAWCLVLLMDYVFNAPAFENVAWMADFEGGVVFRLFKSISPIDLLLSF